MHVLLVATYELGHQPASLGAAAAFLRSRGDEVRVCDVSVDRWDPKLVGWADEVAFSVPMHTAARLARDLADGIDRPVRCFGLYAEQCRDFAIVVDWDRAGAALVPARDSLPPLERYTHLAIDGEARSVGAVVTTFGCAHRCRHCPVPVVFDGRVQRLDETIVADDITQLVQAGARHITFADPDFLNAPQHSRRIVRSLHERHPDVTFDCTVKVEHVLRHQESWDEMAHAGCVFVVSAFESVDDETLARLDKGHTAADAAQATSVLRRHGIDVRPSFLPFTPWTTREDVISLLDFVDEHDLIGSVDPVQYTIRLLLPEGSLLLDHPDLMPHLGSWDAARMSWSWRAADPSIDELHHELSELVEALTAAGEDDLAIYARVRAAAGADPVDLSRVTTGRPRLTESWFCCAEPTEVQLRSIAQR